MSIYLGSVELGIGSSGISSVFVGGGQVWPTGLKPGTTFDFEYNGKVQSIELPKGKYKLQCWGAQGGRSYKSSSYKGGYGGYSEGVLTLDTPTTLYAFVGGQGSNGSSTSLVNGGWNGGGGSVGKSSYSYGGKYGYSYPGSGGGSTDFATVTSDMSYSSGKTNRSSDSLLSRCIVAGGGGGGSYGYYEWEEEYSELIEVTSGLDDFSLWFNDGINNVTYYAAVWCAFDSTPGVTYNISYDYDTTLPFWNLAVYDSDGHMRYSGSFTADKYEHYEVAVVCQTPLNDGSVANGWASIVVNTEETFITSDSNTESSNNVNQGGGVNGISVSSNAYAGKQNSTSSSGSFKGGFGYGGTMTSTNYMHCSGGGGGGWYGGSASITDSNLNYIRYSGGGSGFVNIAANTSYRPSGYTGLQLDSGSTKAGNISFPSVSGGTETGHTGNGYARITVLNPYQYEFDYTGTVQTISLSKGRYKLQVWGAEGGQGYSSSYLGGAGGYSEGILTITEDTYVYVYVGGKGTNYTTSTLLNGGFNGGGNAYTSSSSYRAAAGGGGTDIRIGTDSLYARVIVAGGGGGAGTYSSSSSYRYSGGYGGGTSGGDTSGYNTTYYRGYGGSQTAGGSNYRGSTLNSASYGTLSGFGVGGGVISASSTYNYISGGGGGWYGGGYLYRGAAGGGSGYVYTSSTASNYPNGCLLDSKYYLTDAQTIAGNTSFESVAGGTETGHRGNGYARITKI